MSTKRFIQNGRSKHCCMLGLEGKGQWRKLLLFWLYMFIEQWYFREETAPQIKRTLEGLSKRKWPPAVLNLKLPTLLGVTLERQMEMTWSHALIAQWASPLGRVKLSSQRFPGPWVHKCGVTHTQMRLEPHLVQKVVFVEWIHELRNAWGYQRGEEEAGKTEIFQRNLSGRKISVV